MDEKIRVLQTIHLGICAGAIAAYAFIGHFSAAQFEFNNITSAELVYLFVPIAAILLGSFLFKSQLKQADPKLSLEHKISLYQTASLIRWAILEGAAFVILFIKPDRLVLGLIIILYLLALRPTADRMAADFQNVQ